MTCGGTCCCVALGGSEVCEWVIMEIMENGNESINRIRTTMRKMGSTFMWVPCPRLFLISSTWIIHSFPNYYFILFFWYWHSLITIFLTNYKISLRKLQKVKKCDRINEQLNTLV
jgi:hypothetical protein